MTDTVTITHHQTKPEYQWEVVVPEEMTAMLSADRIETALDLLGLQRNSEVRQQIESLPNGESRSVDAEIDKAKLEELKGLSVKTK
ncbi:MAG: hypothetical protein INR62_13010 [Rhodospirillales bacterium]|nr:hypothetical protein [Acetobacter sp.]